MPVLRSCFPGQVISRFYDIEWPARSSDLFPLDILLWRYIKGRVYRENTTTLVQLKEAIQTEKKADQSRNDQCRDENHAETGRI